LYEPGKLENKPDVIEHMEKIKREREAAMKKNAEDMKKVEAYNKMVSQNQYNQTNNNKYEIKINDMMILIQDLTKENSLLKDRIKQLENK
jgi:predicted  nucleic acid-binding Zn-ribbon protein